MVTADHGEAAVRAYARHRGVTHQAVRKAISVGRLAKSVIMIDGEPKILSFDLADQEWDENTDTTKKPQRESATLAEATLELRRWQARIAEQDYRERASGLVPGEAMAAGYEKDVALARAELLGVPSKCKASIPHLTLAEIKIIDDLIRQALEHVSHNGPG